ncbi:hypothetical protein D3C77_630100 [compost metagenome]
MLHAEHFIDHQAGKDLVVLDYQHPPLLAQRGQFAPQKTTQVHDRQQPPAHVGHPLDPALDAGQQGVTGLVEDFADLAHGRDEQSRAHAEADATPALRYLLPGWQTRRIAPTKLIDFEQSLERCDDIGHAGPGLLVRIIAPAPTLSRPGRR